MDFNYSDFNFPDMDLENFADLESSAGIDAFIAWLEELLEGLHQQLRLRIQQLSYYDFPDSDDYFDFDDFGNYDGYSNSYPH
ncbi:hypothetical protein TGAMA5MH_04682 [Trichoderma gamsii]|uniref:Uncharacterized protein n=1 Tax=Trichoderma gamsii TaxID=398673 RepID=A0A2K0TDW1_9HYPO|nr:hypothetical protein TGAMA5MH_04682 [Trichoderma gamsii]